MASNVLIAPRVHLHIEIVLNPFQPTARSWICWLFAVFLTSHAFVHSTQLITLPWHMLHTLLSMLDELTRTCFCWHHLVSVSPLFLHMKNGEHTQLTHGCPSICVLWQMRWPLPLIRTLCQEFPKFDHRSASFWFGSTYLHCFLHRPSILPILSVWMMKRPISFSERCQWPKLCSFDPNFHVQLSLHCAISCIQRLHLFVVVELHNCPSTSCISAWNSCQRRMDCNVIPEYFHFLVPRPRSVWTNVRFHDLLISHHVPKFLSATQATLSLPIWFWWFCFHFSRSHDSCHCILSFCRFFAMVQSVLDRAFCTATITIFAIGARHSMKPLLRPCSTEDPRCSLCRMLRRRSGFLFGKALMVSNRTLFISPISCFFAYICQKTNFLCVRWYYVVCFSCHTNGSGDCNQKTTHCHLESLCDLFGE